MLRWSLPLVVCACQSATPSLYIATAKDGDDDVSVALMTDGEHVAVYACAGDVARDPYPGWFSGELASDGSFTLDAAGWSLSGAITNDGARGTIVEPDGTVVSWAAAASRHAPMTGVYTNVSSGDTCGATVIVDADDPTQPPVVRGAYCNVMQVTPVAPVALVNGQLGVNVATRTEAPVRLYVAPVRTIPP
jgi:hypothetical protein